VRGNNPYQIVIDPSASLDSVPRRFEVPAGASLEDIANALGLIFRAAIHAAGAFGEAIRVAFDLHRVAMYPALHVPLPTDLEAERKANRALRTPGGKARTQRSPMHTKRL